MQSNGLRSPSSLTAVQLVFVAIHEYFQRLAALFSVFENAMAGSKALISLQFVDFLRCFYQRSMLLFGVS